jgi:FixJ family two-component response regulator
MELTNELVYIVDDEASVGEALSTLLRANGMQAQLFTSGRDFLALARRDSCACLILDLKMPGLGGLEVQKRISANSSMPVIFLTGRGDIPSTVRAIKGGAVDFLTKPVDEEALISSVERALRQDRASRREAAENAKLVARFESLTPREREVLLLLARGLQNKQVAFELGITEYTVQVHRGHIMRKMEADSFATLVKLAAKLKLGTASESNGHTKRMYSRHPLESVQITRGLPMNPQACTIGVIDDDPRVLESLANLLSSFGYSVKTHYNAEQFLRSDTLSGTSCIVTDVEMLQMSGLGLLQYLKKSNCTVPVIIITGKPSERAKTFYLKNGAVGFFRKPVDGDALVELIGSVCI